MAPRMATAVSGDTGPCLVKMLRCFCLRAIHATGKNVTRIDRKLKSWYVHVDPRGSQGGRFYSWPMQSLHMVFACVDAVGELDIDLDAGKMRMDDATEAGEITRIGKHCTPNTVQDKTQPIPHNVEAQAVIAARATESKLEIVLKLQNSMTWTRHPKKFLFLDNDCTLVFP